MPIINRVPFSEKIIFAKNLALMIKAGLPLRESIAVIQEQSGSKKFRRVLNDVLKNIDNGKSLADSLSSNSGVFDSLYANMIRAGEESGTLEENLGYLTQQLEKNQDFKAKIRAAMFYPAIVFGFLIILSLVLIFSVLPKIIPVFQSLRIELPMATRILIKFIEITQSYGLLILTGLIILAISIALLLRVSRIRFIIHGFILRIPVIGLISRNVSIVNLTRTLGTLLRSGIPVVNALDIVRSTSGNLVYQKELKEAAGEVQEGKPISDYLRKRTGVFPLMVSRMISVGEKTGNLEGTLLYISDFYEAEVDRSVKTFSTILEPILLIIIGLAVGFIAMAVITPIYELTRGLPI